MGQQSSRSLFWEVMNPESEYETSFQGVAPRLSSWEGKKIGLFWNGKPNGNVLLNVIGKLLEKRFKNLELIKYDLCIGAGPENIRKMAKECQAIISALGD